MWARDRDRFRLCSRKGRRSPLPPLLQGVGGGGSPACHRHRIHHASSRGSRKDPSQRWRASAGSAKARSVAGPSSLHRPTLIRSAASAPAMSAGAELHYLDDYIIPLMSGMPPPPPPAASFSGISATIASVVRMFLAIEAAFCSAERVTMAG